MRNSLPQDFYHNLFIRIAIAEGTDAEGNKSFQQLRTSEIWSRLLLNVHKLLKLKKLGFLAQPNLLLMNNRC
jgi:hypothetical protein